MSNNDSFQFENEEYRFYVDENIAVLISKEGMFENLADLEKSGQFLSLCEWIEKDPVLNALLILNEPRALGQRAYERFVHKLLKRDKSEDALSIVDSEKKLLRARQMNTFRSFILKMIDYKKLYISGQTGNVVTPFFGLSLSADFRFVSEGMKFCIEHKKYGLHPSGALPFFLPQYISRSKAMEILYERDEISAQEALELGLVNEIFPFEDFEQKCIAKAKKLCEIDSGLMGITKKLTSNFKNELERYFNMESKLIGF